MPKKMIGRFFSHFLLVPVVLICMITRSQPMKVQEEAILLDARIVSVIDSRAFRAVLGNGHECTAWIAPEDEGRIKVVSGTEVRVRFSPCSMRAGQVIQVKI